MTTPTPRFLLSTIESDSHMWGLVYLQLLLEEQGIDVINLGPCVPAVRTLEALKHLRPDVLVISSVNGHGLWQGRALRESAVDMFGADLPPFLIGGKLTTSESENAAAVRELRAAGFAGIFVGKQAIPEFRQWLLQFKQTFTPRSGQLPYVRSRAGSLHAGSAAAAASPEARENSDSVAAVDAA